jgi:sulfur carrier protein
MPEITLQVNGKPVSCLPQSHLPQILEQLGLNPRLIAVEYNGEILHRQYWDATELKNGDRLEIVTIVGGGSEKLVITLPQAWIEQYQTLARQTGRSVTGLLQEAIGQYIANAKDITPETVSVIVISEDDEEWEDEPDEVLTDFLPR